MEDLKIKTAEEMQTENQEGKSQLVERVEINGLSEALSVMKYDNKYFIGFMGGMMTEPTENLFEVEVLATMFGKTEWSLLLNMFTHMIKNRKLLDNLKPNTNE